MTERVKCKRCSASILPQTAARFRDCCARCGPIPAPIHYAMKGLQRFIKWIDPFVSRFVGPRPVDKTLYPDMGRILGLSEAACERVETSKHPESTFIDYIESESIGAIIDHRSEPEEIIEVLKRCYPVSASASWSKIEKEISSLDLTPAEKVLGTIQAALEESDPALVVFETGHDYYMCVVLPVAVRPAFLRRISKSAEIGLLKVPSRRNSP